MKINLLRGAKRIHMIGIGGIGMSALAQLLHRGGVSLSGSDREPSALTQKLEKIGIRMYYGHEASHVTHETDLVIGSLAIGDDNPELLAARRLRIPFITYPEALGEITRRHDTIAICGTHGKSTTTAMIGHILIDAGFDPTVIVGATVPELGGSNFRYGKSKLLVLESCEYKRAFLHYSPRIVLMHTIDPDHLDYYKDEADYSSAFKKFAAKLPRNGFFFGNLDDEDVHEVFHHLQSKKFPTYNTFTYGIAYGQGDFSIQKDELFHRGKPVGTLHLQIPGLHNRSNALAAFSVCALLGVAPRDILRSLHSFRGAGRRFEYKGTYKGVTIIDDYAHHPAEIKATLQAAGERFAGKKICVVFQPHQYNRTKHFLKEFGAAFGGSDLVVVPNIYDVRDSAGDRKSVSAEALVAEITKNRVRAHHGEGFEKTISFLKKHAAKFDVIVTMGAGDVWKIADALL